MFEGLADLPWWAPVLLCLAALLAGWVDAVVGGGGLIQLPALLLVPGFAPVHALATNKLGSVMGTLTSATTYYRRVRPDLRTTLPVAGVAFLGSMLGAVLASHLPTSVFTPVVMVALVVVLVFTVARPRLGSDEEDTLPLPATTLLLRTVPFGALVGFYDGVMGPGTGSFLVLGLAVLTRCTFLRASATAKIVNAATNLGALAWFVPLGAVEWRLGVLIGVANMLGGYLGARTAVRLGSRFVRAVLIVVVSALLLRLGYQEFAG